MQDNIYDLSIIDKLNKIERQLNMINFSLTKDYVGERFTETLITHLSYIYFYGNTMYWCNQINQFITEALDTRISKHGRKAKIEDVYKFINKSNFINKLFNSDSFVVNFINGIPYTESKPHKFRYNLDLDINKYLTYIKEVIGFLFDKNTELSSTSIYNKLSSLDYIHCRGADEEY